MMIYFEVLIQASNRKTELRFMVSDSRGIRPQPGLIKYVKEKFMNNLKKYRTDPFNATSRGIGIIFVKIERDVVVRFSFGVN